MKQFSTLSAARDELIQLSDKHQVKLILIIIHRTSKFNVQVRHCLYYATRISKSIKSIFFNLDLHPCIKLLAYGEVFII